MYEIQATRKAVASSIVLLVLFTVSFPTVHSSSVISTEAVLRVNNPAPEDTHADGPSLAISSNGTVHVVWTEYNLTTDLWHIMYARLLPAAIEFDDKRSLAACRVAPLRPAIAAFGVRVHIAYSLDASCPGAQIGVATSWDDGLSIGPSVGLPSTDSGFNYMPRVLIASDGTVYVLWTQGRLGEAWVSLTRSSDGGQSFEPPVMVNPAHNFSWEFDAAIDPFDVIHVVWLDILTPNQTWEDLYYSKTDSSLTFPPPRKIDANATSWHSIEFPSIHAQPATTRILVAWADTRNYPPLTGGYDLFLVESLDSGYTWQPQRQLTHSPREVTEWTPSLTSDELGRSYVAWADSRGRNADATRGWDVYLARFGQPDSFEEWLIGDAYGQDQSSPVIAANAGRIHVAFSDKSAGRVWGNARLSDIRYVRVDPPPSIPTLAYSDVTPNSVELAWSQTSDPDFQRYEVQLADGETLDFRVVYVGTERATTSTRIVGLLENSPYTLRLLVFDQGGGYAASSPISLETPNAPPSPPILWVTETTSTSASVEWTIDGSADFLDYVLELGSSPDLYPPLRSVRIQDRNANAYTFTALTERTSYSARLTVRDSHGATSFSQVVALTTANGPPDSVRILEALELGSTSAIVAWERSYALDFASYDIYASTDPTSSGTLIASLFDPGTTRVVLEGLAPNTTYWLRVSVVDSGGLVATSPPVSVTTLPDSTQPKDGRFPLPSDQDFDLTVLVAVAGISIALALAALYVHGRAGRRGNRRL